MEVTGVSIKKHKYKKTLKIFSSKTKSFHDLHKVLKSTVLNTVCDKIYLTKARRKNLSIKVLLKTSKIRVFIYGRDICNLQTKIMSFPDQVKLLKKVVFLINANTKNSQIKHFP